MFCCGNSCRESAILRLQTPGQAKLEHARRTSKTWDKNQGDVTPNVVVWRESVDRAAHSEHSYNWNKPKYPVWSLCESVAARGKTQKLWMRIYFDLRKSSDFTTIYLSGRTKYSVKWEFRNSDENFLEKQTDTSSDISKQMNKFKWKWIESKVKKEGININDADLFNERRKTNGSSQSGKQGGDDPRVRCGPGATGTHAQIRIILHIKIRVFFPESNWNLYLIKRHWIGRNQFWILSH